MAGRGRYFGGYSGSLVAVAGIMVGGIAIALSGIGGLSRGQVLIATGYASLTVLVVPLLRRAAFGMEFRVDAERAADEADRIRHVRQQAELTLAELRGELARNAEEGQTSPNGDPQTAQLEARIAALEGENRTLREQRAAEASIELGRAFQQTAARYARATRLWLFGLLAATGLLGAASLFWVFERQIAKDATAAQIAAALAAGAVTLGVPAYLVRVAANQFRAMQRLAIVAEGKAAILRTFSDIVSAHQDPAQVATLTERVASSVFTVSDPGSMTSAESVNALEVILGDAIKRMK